MPLISFGDQDAKMNAAIDRAKRSLTVFFENFVAPKNNQKSFLLKVAFESDDDVEHIWIADLDASVMPLEGTVANEPSMPGIKFMQRITFQPNQITDWMFVEDGFT